MVYLITGKLIRAEEVLRLPHDEYVQLLRTKYLPTVQFLSAEKSKGRVLAGGMPAGSREIAMIVDLAGADSHRCVRHFLASLPIMEYYEWHTTPLETFEELAASYDN